MVRLEFEGDVCTFLRDVKRKDSLGEVRLVIKSGYYSRAAEILPSISFFPILDLHSPRDHFVE